MTVPVFQPMSLGQILDRTFRLYREHFAHFIAIVAIIQVPFALLSIIVLAMIPGVAMTRGGTMSPAEARAMLMALVPTLVVVGILNMIALVLCSGALTKAVSESYLGRESSVGETYRFVLPRLGTLIWAGILTVLVIYLGLILCIVPGIIFACWFWLTTPAVVVENLKATKAMSRSKALVSGNLGKVFVIGFVVFCIALVVNWACGTISGLLSAGAAQENRLLALIIQQVVALVGQVLVAPIGAAACILFYYDMRIRKEAFDLEMLANSMGGTGGPPNVGTPVQ